MCNLNEFEFSLILIFGIFVFLLKFVPSKTKSALVAPKRRQAITRIADNPVYWYIFH